MKGLINMLKRRVVLQAVSVLMGAMVAGSSVPVIAVYAVSYTHLVPIFVGLCRIYKGK